MSIDIKTAGVDPVRKTFDHIAAKLGPGKAPTRYQEGTFGLQPDANFHYRPTWDPRFELYDRARTKLVMNDFEDLLDPRQYYYATYTIQRAKQQESLEKNFSFVEKRNMLATLEPSWAEKIRRYIVPLRHVHWAANNNNTAITAHGWGAPITSAAMFQATDHLGIAQYITRIALVLDNNNPAILDAAKKCWLEDPVWQPLRRFTEDTMVVEDWFELLVVQNFLIDTAIHKFAFEYFDAELANNGGGAFAMLSEFMVEWHAEAGRWVDAVMKVAAEESAANSALLAEWIATWTPRVEEALSPLTHEALGGVGDEALANIMNVLATRSPVD